MSNRNKSSLKPLRREPLQDLQMVSAVNSDEDTTSTITLAALAKRRVSFSGRNSVKEYVPCAEPICVMSTPAYEETFAHLSSDSSCLGNNSGQNDENNMSQTLMAINRPRPSMPLAPPTRVSLNQNTQQQFQKYHNSLPQQQQQQQHQQIAAQDDSLNNSDMCMTEPINSTKLYESSAIDQTVADVSHVAGDMLLTPVVDRAADTSSGDMSFTRAFGRPDKNSTCINFTSAANDATSQNNSTCMSFTKAIVANNDNFPNDNSMIQNNSMSFTKAIVANDERFSAGLSQNNSTCMSFTKAIVVNDENSQMGNVLSHTSSSQMSFTKAIVVNDENSQMGNVLSQTSSSHMSFTKAMVLNDETDNVLSQNNLSHMSLTKAIVGENVPTDDNVSSQNSSTHMSFTKAIVSNDVQNGNASMSFTKAFSAADELKADGNVTMTIDDSVTNFKNATNFTMDPGTDEEMRRLMQEVEMEETLDSEKLKSYRLSDVSFLVRENLVSGKSKRARRRSSIATASSNSPIDLSVTGNRFGQQNIDEEEEEEEEEEMDVEEEEEEEGGEKELSGREEEVKSSEENGKEGRRLEEGEFEKEDTRNREENCVLGVEEECERERKSEGKDLKEDIERKALEEEENELEEGRQVNLEERRVRELEEERLRKRKGNNDFENVGIEREVEDIGEDVEREDVVDRMETDAEIQSRKDNNADDLDMSIVEDIEEVPNSAKEKDENVKKEETLHLNLREETVLATSRREETLSKKTEETFCLNLNSVSEMVESSVAREDNEREEAECDEGGVKEDVTGSDKEQSADMGSNQNTRSTVVMSAVCKDQPPEQLLQECTRAKRKSDSLDLSREEFDVIESPSKLARMEVPLSPEAPAVTSEEQQSNVTAEIANSSRTRKPRASIGKRHSSSHSLDETRLTFSEMAESLLDASSSLASLDNSSRLSGAFLASINASIPVRYVEEEVAPNETRYSFYGGAVVVRVEAQSGATEQLKVAEVLVDEDADVHCLIFANKTKGLFAEKVLACQSMADVKKAISEINSFVYNHETQHQSLLRLWMNAKLDFVDGRLKYNAVCYDTMTWFSVMMDPDIIFKDLSDDAITVKTCIGDVQESYIKHLYRCCVMSPDRLKHFTDSLEKYVSSSKT